MGSTDTLLTENAGLRFLRDERGAALVDYALIAALFSLAMVAGLQLVSHQLGNNLNDTGNSFTNMAT
ncbi:MAG: Flp family type IVb pilin, partial [Vulcanimicrobiaceae bacterium]